MCSTHTYFSSTRETPYRPPPPFIIRRFRHSNHLRHLIGVSRVSSSAWFLCESSDEVDLVRLSFNLLISSISLPPPVPLSVDPLFVDRLHCTEIWDWIVFDSYPRSRNAKAAVARSNPPGSEEKLVGRCESSTCDAAYQSSYTPAPSVFQFRFGVDACIFRFPVLEDGDEERKAWGRTHFYSPSSHTKDASCVRLLPGTRDSDLRWLRLSMPTAAVAVLFPPSSSSFLTSFLRVKYSLSLFCPTIGNLTSRIDDLNIHGIIFYISFIFPKKIMVFFGGSLAYRCFAYFESKSFLFILVTELFPKSCLLNLIPENWEQDTIAN